MKCEVRTGISDINTSTVINTPIVGVDCRHCAANVHFQNCEEDVAVHLTFNADELRHMLTGIEITSKG